MEQRPHRTLFDPTLQHSESFQQLPAANYAEFVRVMVHQRVSGLPDLEAEIFDNLLFGENFLYDEIGVLLGGPLILSTPQTGVLDLSEGQELVEVHGWVEKDRLTFERCTADGILLVEKGTIAADLYKREEFRRLNLLLACGPGIPRVRARRVLHRLSEQFRIPVFVLADNDTWGYFLYSVLKRGSIEPAGSCEYLAVPDTRFLGLRAGDIEKFSELEQRKSRWHHRWDLRLDCMRKYACFQSGAWQREFDSFKEQNAKFELNTFIHVGWERFIEYITWKLKMSDWLK